MNLQGGTSHHQNRPNRPNKQNKPTGTARSWRRPLQVTAGLLLGMSAAVAAPSVAGAAADGAVNSFECSARSNADEVAVQWSNAPASAETAIVARQVFSDGNSHWRTRISLLSASTDEGTFSDSAVPLGSDIVSYSVTLYDGMGSMLSTTDCSNVVYEASINCTYFVHPISGWTIINWEGDFYGNSIATIAHDGKFRVLSAGPIYANSGQDRLRPPARAEETYRLRVMATDRSTQIAATDCVLTDTSAPSCSVDIVDGDHVVTIKGGDGEVTPYSKLVVSRSVGGSEQFWRGSLADASGGVFVDQAPTWSPGATVNYQVTLQTVSNEAKFTTECEQ